MEVTSQSDVQSNRTLPNTQTAEPSALSSDFETFLKMLTTQMENQDPLNPIESADFAVQLATFSGVEQQVRTNDLLTGLGAGLASDALSQYAGWVGLSARSTAPVKFDGAPITLDLEPRENANRAVLEVSDQSGRLVETRDVAGTAGPYQWTGQSADGQSFLAGQYTFNLKSYSGEDLIGEAPVEVFQQVAEARLNSGQVEIVFDGGGVIAATGVTALRDAG
ncbi:MAG: flagellar hook assembly protein FlgD [Rhodobacteraceae bacterium]|nr:flagellar hook assembly protein FlgD [Paracoccaceae bacterium]